MTDPLVSIPVYYGLAAALGLAGQFLRALLGLLKEFRDSGRVVFSPLYFLLSQPLGALSGVLGALVFDLGAQAPSEVTAHQLWDNRNYILMALSAGYFGADVIEGILRRHAPLEAQGRADLPPHISKDER